ncbi:MAG TPA: Rpn family recombination-promoting nuclease/putative transposase [Clostridiales bacterium]|nr:Rpn family recombination-promoting nuclease/putative transposase [Clostridiales bacterium]
MQLLVKETSGSYIAKNKGERLNPLNDYLFRQYMGTEECKICLISFLNAVLEEELTDVEIIENLELPQETPEGKFSRLDIRAKLPNGTQVNIEVQLLDENNIVKRSQYYNGRLFISGIGLGDDYKELGKVISINILNFNYLDYPEFHISSHFRVDQHPEDVLSDDQEIHFLELKKFYKSEKYDRKNPLHRWMKYFDRNLDEDELKELVEMDKAIAAAEERSKRAAASEKEMRYYEALEDARRNMISSMNYQREQGFREGEDRGRKEGRKEGKQEGIQEGELRFATLTEHLLRDQRMEELQQSIKDSELRESLYKEYAI